MYVDAIFDKTADNIRVVERVNDSRVYKDYPIKYTFFYPDPKGKYLSIYREPLSKIVCKSTKDFRHDKAVHSNKRLYESDLNPIFSCLSENYLNANAPDLHVAFFDIEVILNYMLILRKQWFILELNLIRLK